MLHLKLKGSYYPMGFARVGQVIYGRTNDLPPYLKEGCRSEPCAPLGGNRFSLTTSSFINGEEGLNEHGLAVAMTFVMSRLEDIRPGFNSCFAVRYLQFPCPCGGSLIEAAQKL